MLKVEDVDLNVIKTNLREFKEDIMVKLSFIAGLYELPDGVEMKDVMYPMLIVGQPGIAKTASVYEAAKEITRRCKEAGKDIEFGLKKIVLNQTIAGELQGIPLLSKDEKVMRAIMPDLPNPEIDGDYGILFFDELTTTSVDLIGPALSLADDTRSTGVYTLPKGWLVVAAGNVANTNFVRLDSAMIQRFSVYDIDFNYKTDWKEYAIKTNVNPDILAFLNFSPDSMVDVYESDDIENLGLESASPRTWTALDKWLKMKEATGKPVPLGTLAATASRYIGKKTASEFAAFRAFKDKLKVSPEDILDGKAKPYKEPSEEEFNIILEGCLKQFRDRGKKLDYSNVDDKTRMLQYIANYFNWTIELNDVEKKIISFQRIASEEAEKETGISKQMVFDDYITEHCPKFIDFFSTYSEQILQVMDIQ